MLVYVGPFGTRLFPAHVRLKLTNSFSIKAAKSYAIGLPRQQTQSKEEGGVLYPENPSHPPRHIIIRNHIPPRQNHQSYTRRRKLERIIEIWTHHPHRPKEQTHAH